MAVNFTKYQDDITTAWRKVVDSTNTQNWALFGYEAATNIIKLTSTGSQGLNELVQEFNCSLIQYAFCRVIDPQIGLNKLVLINWQGDSAPLSRKGLCASHVGEVTNYFKGCTQSITIRNDDEATVEHLMEQIVKTSSSRINLAKQQQSSLASNHNDIHNNTAATNDDSLSSSSSQKKVDIGSELAVDRKSFWQRQEEEEKERIAEEKRRAADKQAQFEKERKQREEKEAKKLAETIKERDRLIEANKRAEKTSVSQPSSMISTTDATDDENSVGRRSELIRLERNQETQSLISKGLIKNKRAIFEQAQQQQQQSPQPTLSRRSSGAIVAQRMNAFKSLDNNTSITSSVADSTTTSNAVNKLADSFVEKVSVYGGDAPKNTSVTPIKKEIEPVVLTREEEDVQTPNSNVVSSSVVTESNLDESSDQDATAETSAEESKLENGTALDVSQDVNGNSENSFSKKSENDPVTNEVITNEELIIRGKNSSVEAIALFDYQAADNTEISFDPDDKIGHIQKVDPGWWHGLVMTGRFKGQVGLFPANYVQESV